MIPAIRAEAIRREITRLCHFTPSRKLAHIAADKIGILATSKLEEDDRSVFDPTDLKRLDGYKDCISCSIEYPNAWYMDKASSTDEIFRDWVILFIRPDYLWMSGTRFCQRNAAAEHGKGVSEGEEAFRSMYSSSVIGAQGRRFDRRPNRLICCPTDDQAEVLIPDVIVLSDILAIGVRNETQAKNEIARLKLVGVQENKFRFIIVTDLFDKYKLSGMIKEGNRPEEQLWKPE